MASSAAVVDDKLKPTKTGVLDSKKDSAEAAVAVSYWELFRAADSFDKIALALGTLAAVGNGAALPVFTIIFGEFTDLFGNPNMATFDAGIRDLALKFLYIAMATGVVSYIEMAAWMWSGNRQVNRLRLQYLEALLQQDVAFFDTEGTTGQALQGLNEDCQLIQAAISEKMSTFLKMCSTFLVGIIIAFVKGWDMTLVLLATTPLTMAVAFAISHVTTSATAAVNESYGKANSVAQQNLAQIRTVAAYGQEKKTLDEYSGQLEGPLRVGIKLAVQAGLAMGGLQFIMFATYAVAFVYGAWRVSLGLYTGGQVLTVLLSVMMGGFQLGMVGPNLQHFNKGRAAAVRIFAMLERKPAISVSAGGQRLEAVSGSISLKAVNFTYPARPDVPVLKNFCLEVPAGKTVALVGGSGSGKSTTAALVERFYDPNSGSISLDGHDLRSLDLQWLRNQMALVSQEPTLFAISIFENIALGRSGATREEVVEAAKAANAHNFISALPGGYDTHVGERGLQLSGGQKQRIAIARAILKNPKILLLDEATSALDTQSERLVQAAINKISADRTTIVIAHRLSTICHADVIAVMSKGEIVEQGTHDQLVANPNGAYTALVSLQMQHQQEDSQASVDDVKEELLDTAESAPPAGHLALQVAGDAAPGASVLPLMGKHSSDGDDKAAAVGAFAVEKAAGGKDSKAGDKKPAEPEVQVPMSRLLALNRPDWPYGVVGFIAAGLSGCAQPAVAFLLAAFITVFYIRDMDELRRQASFYGLMFFVVACAMLLSYTAMHACLGIMAQRMSKRLRVLVLGSILRQEVGWFDREENSSGVLSSRLASDTVHVRGAVGDVFGLVALNGANLLFGFLIAYAYNWRMALVVTALLPVVALAGFYQMKFAFSAQGEVDGLYAGSNHAITEGLSSIRVIHAYNLQAHVCGMYAKSLAAVTEKLNVISNAAGVANGFANFTMFAIYSLIIWFGAQEIKYGRSDFDAMLKAFFGILFAAIGISQSALQFPEIGNAKAAVQRVFPLLDRRSAIDPDSSNGVSPPAGSLKGEIVLRDVTFSYPSRPSVTIFNGLNLTIPAGKTVALVGQSGSGKSTVVGLIERFYDPTGGSVLLDGRDIREYNLRWLRSQMGLVSQEPLLFSASIIDNIRYGKPDATLEEVEAAARAANAHDFVSAQPEGYNTYVGEQGVQLSGGQKQRIAIARAIVRRPQILLLDEATSALDASSEHEVQAALDVIMKGPTCVVIAHRLTTIRGADLICVVQGGAVLEQGNHEQLMGMPGSSYAQLVRAQESSQVVY